MKKIILNHLYSLNLNIYGDLGNIIALQHHARNFGVDLEVVHTEINGPMIPADIYFIGGGQDEDQMLVFRDLLKHKKFIEEEVAKEKIFLLVCGGFQLFGKYFIDSKGNRIEGLGILDMTTESPDEKVTSRCIGNVVVKMDPEFVKYWQIDTGFSKYLVGFENHGGQTHLSPILKPIGQAVVGFGNNSNDKLEGCWHKNIIGTYLHGSLLPKNPHLATAILNKIVQIKRMETEKTDTDRFEMEKRAHEEILNRFL